MGGPLPQKPRPSGFILFSLVCTVESVDELLRAKMEAGTGDQVAEVRYTAYLGFRGDQTHYLGHFSDSSNKPSTPNLALWPTPR